MGVFASFWSTGQNIYNSFIITVQIERSNPIGIAFDGLDSYNQSVSIRIKPKYKFKDFNNYRDYNSNLPLPPVLYTLNNAY